MKSSGCLTGVGGSGAVGDQLMTVEDDSEDAMLYESSPGGGGLGASERQRAKDPSSLPMSKSSSESPSLIIITSRSSYSVLPSGKMFDMPLKCQSG